MSKAAADDMKPQADSTGVLKSPECRVQDRQRHVNEVAHLVAVMMHVRYDDSADATPSIEGDHNVALPR